MQLRDYQSNAVKWICDQCERGQNPLFCCATGGGKTVIMSAAIKELAKIHRLKTGKNARFLSLVHRTEIHESNFATLKRVAPEITATKIDATQKNFKGQVHFASVQTLQRIVEKLAFYPNNRYDYILIDESHHGISRSYIKIINGLLAENGRIIGVSATPNRGDKRPLDVLFQSAYVVTTGDLIRQHWLCSPICRDFSKKFKNLKPKKENTNPKFQESQTLTLSQNFTRARNQRNADAAVKLVSDCVPDLLKAIESRNKVIVFVPNHSFGQILFDLIKDKISSDYLRDGISGDDRRISFARFENGQTKVLINVDIATEGYDCPAIDCVVDFDTNGSEGQWVQKIGRGLRLADGKKDCLVLDFGCNLEKYPDLEQKCNLSGEIKEKAGGGFGFFTSDDTRVEIATESCDSQNGVEVKMYHNESAGLYFFSWGNYYVGVGNNYVCVQFNDRFHEFVRNGESLEYLGSVEDVSKLTAVNKLNDIDIPANNIQISLLSPRYSTANLRKNEARALIFWDSWKKEIINKIKTPI